MSIVYMLIPLGLVLVGVGLWAFFWAVGAGQFDDLDSPGWTVLTDDERPSAGPDENARPEP
jgi:cbb3-type cytochrome oxidase maturation protein